MEVLDLDHLWNEHISGARMQSLQTTLQSPKFLPQSTLGFEPAHPLHWPARLHCGTYKQRVRRKMSSDTRQRLRPWLQSKLDSGLLPGVQWVNKSDGTFKLPWKHGGKQDWSKHDSQIFKEWALHTGRFREGIDKEDWSTWKTRLRCALNKLPDIEEVKRMSKLEEPNPYRVFRFLPVNTVSTVQQHPTISCQLQTEAQTQPLMEGYRSCIDRAGDDDVEMEVEVGQTVPTDFMQHNRGNLVIEDRHYPTDSHTGAPMIGNNGHLIPTQAQVETTISERSTSDPTSDFKLTIQLKYGAHLVGEYVTEKAEGCRLFYGQTRDGSSMLGHTGVEIFGPSEAEQICFPALNQGNENPKDTGDLLRVMDRGLVLECINGDIFATRLCRCVIFVHSESLLRDTGATPVRLQRNQPRQKVFDFNNYFWPAYCGFITGQGPKPSAEMKISFGQLWNPTLEDLQNPLISASVTHSKAHSLLQQLKENACLTSIHISRPDEYDNYVEQLRCVEEIQQFQG